MFSWLPEMQLQLANHKPVIQLNVRPCEDSVVLNSFDVMSPEQDMTSLALWERSAAEPLSELALSQPCLMLAESD